MLPICRSRMRPNCPAHVGNVHRRLGHGSVIKASRSGYKMLSVTTDPRETLPDAARVQSDSAKPFDLELLRGARIQLDEGVERLTGRVYQLLAQGERKQADTLARSLTRTLTTAIDACQRMSLNKGGSTVRRPGTRES